uniref:SAM pointed domain-containing Ets transcription factor-like n=1 Tax=Callorhinchus milii TaxID=7868 RepID=A0A4W3K9H8_CALMI
MDYDVAESGNFGEILPKQIEALTDTKASGCFPPSVPNSTLSTFPRGNQSPLHWSHFNVLQSREQESVQDTSAGSMASLFPGSSYLVQDVLCKPLEYSTFHPQGPEYMDVDTETLLEQIQSLLLREVCKEIQTACRLLNISPDPTEWSADNVGKWILWTEHQYKLPNIGKKGFLNLSGREMCYLTVEQFKERAATGGDVLHAHLDIWKSEANDYFHYLGKLLAWTPGETPFSFQLPVHLWLFLKDLLLKPHNYGRFIRWLDKEKGIFKIEDSAQVARLWGIRKNRPAMNYDKLSRSIRQYYKKGIIKKPDIAQRLVYQFVHPL